MKLKTYSISIDKSTNNLSILKRAIIELLCTSLILLFIYAGISKFLDYSIFKYQLGKSPYITSYANVLAWSLPAFEIIVGFMLALRPTRMLALYCSLFLMTMFTSYIIVMMSFSYDLPCSCGGILANMGWNAHLWFNIGFTIISLTAILLLMFQKNRGN
jgi:uncharacterized membrane protein YphA (DoxX/SURF4 family)